MKSGTAQADIAAAISYIDRHGCERLTVGRVVKETQRVPTAVFLRSFRTSTGMTVQTAILRRQLEEARRLLTGSELSLAFIASHCGFPNLAAMERALYAADGRTPAELRRESPLDGTRSKSVASPTRRPRSTRSLPVN